MDAAPIGTPLSTETRTRIRHSIARQTLLRTLGVEIVDLARGRVTLALPFRADLCQQHGYIHAGALTSVVDSACGYAALSLMPPDREVLTVEFKVNLLAPGSAEHFRATGTVVRAGRTLTICRGEVTAADGSDGLIAAMQATMMAVDNTQAR